MKVISVGVEKQKYSVFLKRGLLSNLQLSKLYQGQRLLIIADKTAYEYHGETFIKQLNTEYNTDIFYVSEPEKEKKLSSIEKITEWALTKKFDRNSFVICFGGGAVGDLGGFLASVYMRGIPFVQVPTTLLAQVDASVGGKTAVNLGFAKNIIGTFYQPKAVFIDPDILMTLPENEFFSGLAESLKMSVIADEILFSLFEKKLYRDCLDEVIERSVKIKSQIVAQDERERGCRILLNLGHTTAHAIEAATNYHQYLHGEAVAFGCIVAAFLSTALGFCNSTDCDRIVHTFKLLIPNCDFSHLDTKTVSHFTQYDKKRVNKNIHFILPCAIGKAFVYDQVNTTDFRKAFVEAQKFVAEY